MIIINKTKERIHSHHRRGVFLNPGSNDIDDALLTKSEREMIAAFVKHGIVEIVEAPPESGTQVLPAFVPSPVPIKKRRSKSRAKSR